MKQLTPYFGVAALAALLLTTGGRPAYAAVQGVTIDPRGTLYSGGAFVTVSGQFLADEGQDVYVEVVLQQSKGGKTLIASGIVGPVTATGEPQAWALSLGAPFGEAFASGPAVVSVSVKPNGSPTGAISAIARVWLRK
jgi:hypothetical protein